MHIGCDIMILIKILGLHHKRFCGLVLTECQNFIAWPLIIKSIYTFSSKSASKWSRNLDFELLCNPVLNDDLPSSAALNITGLERHYIFIMVRKRSRVSQNGKLLFQIATVYTKATCSTVSTLLLCRPEAKEADMHLFCVKDNTYIPIFQKLKSYLRLFTPRITFFRNILHSGRTYTLYWNMLRWALNIAVITNLIFEIMSVSVRIFPPGPFLLPAVIPFRTRPLHCVGYFSCQVQHPLDHAPLMHPEWLSSRRKYLLYKWGPTYRQGTAYISVSI